MNGNAALVAAKQSPLIDDMLIVNLALYLEAFESLLTAAILLWHIEQGLDK